MFDRVIQKNKKRWTDFLGHSVVIGRIPRRRHITTFATGQRSFAGNSVPTHAHRYSTSTHDLYWIPVCIRNQWSPVEIHKKRCDVFMVLLADHNHPPAALMTYCSQFASHLAECIKIYGRQGLK